MQRGVSPGVDLGLDFDLQRRIGQDPRGGQSGPVAAPAILGRHPALGPGDLRDPSMPELEQVSHRLVRA